MAVERRQNWNHNDGWLIFHSVRLFFINMSLGDINGVLKEGEMNDKGYWTSENVCHWDDFGMIYNFNGFCLARDFNDEVKYLI